MVKTKDYAEKEALDCEADRLSNIFMLADVNYI